MKLIILSGGLALIAAWAVTPYVIISSSWDCVASTVLIYEEPDKTIISKGTRYTLPGGNEHYYTAEFEIKQKGMPEVHFRSERTIDTVKRFNLDSFNLHTTAAFRIAGPSTADAGVGRYIDPLAEKGFSARIYLFRAGDSGGFTGFRGLPLNKCQRVPAGS